MLFTSNLNPSKPKSINFLRRKNNKKAQLLKLRALSKSELIMTKKIKEVDAKRDEAQKKMDELKVKYYKDLDLYEDQQDLLRYIKYVQDEIDYKRKRKEE